MATFKLGSKAKIYYSVTGQGGTFVELINVKDVTLNLDKKEADATTRANAGWEAVIASLKSASVDFDMVWDTDDAGFRAIRNAFFNDTVLGMKILDGENGQGLLADFMVVKFTRSEPLTEVITVSVTVKPTYSDEPPSWIGGS